MSVRYSLLAILNQGPCYGYQLRMEFERRTGATWPLNVGQIYSTLERLERDGLATKAEASEQGHVYYEITDAGRATVADWLDSPVVRSASARDELVVKLALAITLPGLDVARVMRTQREASERALYALSREKHELGSPQSIEHVAAELVLESLIAQAEADIRWLDRVAEKLARTSQRLAPLALSTEAPKRGRPSNAVGSANSPLQAHGSLAVQ